MKKLLSPFAKALFGKFLIIRESRSFRLNLRPISIFGTLLCCILLFQNCGKSFQAANFAQTQFASTAPLAAPTLSLAKPIPALSNSRDLNIIINISTDSRAKVQSLICQLDAKPAVDCSSLQANFAAIEDGDHTLRINAEDSKGQKADELTALFRIDATKPVLQLLQGPAAITGNKDASIGFSAVDNLSGVKQTECMLDAGVYAACTSPMTLTNLAEGAHVVKIRSSDLANNVSDIITINWTVNSAAGTLAISAQPSAFTNNRTASFTFSGMAGGVALASYECSLDNGAFAACVSPKSYTIATDGQHNFRVQGRTVAGVLGSPVPANWTLDTIAPTVPALVANVGAITKLKTASISYSSSDQGSAIALYQCSVDGGGFANCASPSAFVNLGDGTHSLAVKARDNAGNESAVGSFSWMVDSALPVLAITASPAASTESKSASFTFTATDSASGIATIECSLDNGAFAACVSPRAYSALAVGNHSFVLRATDKAANQASQTFNWKIMEPLNLDGSNLYSMNCAGCHNALASSTKLNRTADQITGAIVSIPAMQNIQLTAAQIAAIAGVLNAPTPMAKYTCTDKTVQGTTGKALRRLSKREMTNTLADLLGADIAASTTSLTSYPNDPYINSVDQFQALHTFEMVDAMVDISIEASAKLVANRTALNKVAPACIGTGLDAKNITDTCINQFVTSFGRRALRRPPTAAQSAAYLAVYKSADPTLSTATVQDRLQLLIARILQAPDLGFHFLETTGAATGGRIRLDNYSVASRLSYQITGSMPDDTLLNAAANNQLSTLAQIQAQAARLVDTAGGRRQFRDAIAYQLKLGTVVAPSSAPAGRFGIAKDTTTLNRIATEAVNETLDYAEYIAYNLNGTFKDLMTSNLAFPKSADMAKILGVNYNGGTAPVSLAVRRGLVARPSIVMSNLERERPIHRGVLVRTRFLCDVIPPPPANADQVAADNAATVDQLLTSSRELASVTTKSSSCLGCHASLNPPGFALGVFGPLGERRASEMIFNANGQQTANLPIDTNVTNLNVILPTDTVSDEQQMIDLLASSSKGPACMTQFLFENAKMRSPAAADNCQLSEIESVISKNMPIKEALSKVSATDDIFWKGQ
jgi:hypothetical protein